MKSIKGLAFVITLLGMMALAPFAAAHMLITYKPSSMLWSMERSMDKSTTSRKMGGDGSTWYDSNFFQSEKVELDLSFITPDFDPGSKDLQHLEFYDPLININVSNFFSSFTIDKGAYFSLEIYPEELLQIFSLSFSFTEHNPDGITRRGSFSLFGYLNGKDGGASSSNQFTFEQNNWLHKKQDQTFLLDTIADFKSDNTNSITIKKIGVPEPHAPALLLMGLVCLGVARKLQRGKPE